MRAERGLRRAVVRATCFGLPLVLTFSLLNGEALAAAMAARPDPLPSFVDSSTSVRGYPVAGKAPSGHREPVAQAIRQPVWPAAATADTAMPAGAAKAAGAAAPARVTGMPVLVGAPAKGTAPQRVQVRMFDQATTRGHGIRGLLMRVAAPAAGAARLSVDYSQFAEAYGGGWSSRLRLVQLPECALTAPSAPACQGRPLPSSNDPARRLVSAEVTVQAAAPDLPTGRAARPGGTLLALEAGPSGGAGSFAATSLAASSTWSHGGSHGGFMWSYSMRTPPGAGGPTPQLGVSYSSQSVDGRMAASNNQPSWLGSGFSMEQSYVERRYQSCARDTGGGANNNDETGDLCWSGEHIVLSLNGAAVELFNNAGTWVARNPTESKIEKLTDASFANGDDDNEYWKVTDGSGKTYWFGRNRLPGWTSGKPVTNSVLYVPVAGNHVGEPCRHTQFKDSFCNQAWRWSLDYVEDVHGNTMSYWYDQEANHYAKNRTQTALAGYHRAGNLNRIDYGTDRRTTVGGTATDTVYLSQAPMSVEFGLADRCFTDCATKSNWRDAPLDQECTAGQTDCNVATPTFWTKRRLATVKTKIWDATATPAGYRYVDEWTFRQSLPDHANDGGLWLNGITHSGVANGPGAAVTLPEITFGSTQLPNRVDGVHSDFNPAMNWRRINSIITESGGQIWVDYSGADCATPGNLPAALDQNSRRCYPVKWKPSEDDDPRTDYFHKYVVDSVVQYDLTGGSPPVETSYEYKNPGNQALWHFDDVDGLGDAETLSWGQWRGYPAVVTRTGTGATQTVAETLYFRGMHGDKTASGTRTVSVEGLEGGPVTDHDWYAGQAREQLTWFNGQVHAASVITPWHSGVKATRSVDGHTVEARLVRVGSAVSRQRMDDGSYRRLTSTAQHDETGRVTQQASFGVDAGADTDDSCTTTSYVPAGTTTMASLMMEVKSWVGHCGTAPTSADRILDYGRFHYDGQALGAVPQKGLITRIDSIRDWNGGTPLYDTERSFTYDVAGRTKTTTDQAGFTSQTDYTPAAGGPITKQSITTVVGTTSVDLDPAWGAVKTETDLNSRKRRAGYDGLGRVAKVWELGRLTTQTPDAEYTYDYSQTAPTVVTTRRLDANGNQQSSYQFLDSWLRARQSQTAAYGGGALMSETFYDAAGRAWKTNGVRWDENATAGVQMLMPVDLDVLAQNRKQFDALGRVTDEILYRKNVEKWRVRTDYHGDHTTVTPPDGASTLETWFDASGRTTERRTYHGRTTGIGYDATRYQYDLKGQLSRVTDASNNAWSFAYDMKGRQVQADDPDTGRTTTTYDAQGFLETTTDANNNTLAYVYDAKGRIASIRDGSRTSTSKRIEWTYDLGSLKGLVSATTRWIGSDAYVSKVLAVDGAYRPLQTQVTIPAVEGALAGDYLFKSTYWPDGSPKTTTLPAKGGLDEEVLTYGYDAQFALPEQLKTNYAGTANYVIDIDYDHFFRSVGMVRSTQLAGASWVKSTSSFDDSTGRLVNRMIQKSSGAQPTISDATYGYDASGNVLSIDDNPAGGVRDTQCFTYDHLRRLTEAWTPQSSVCGAPGDGPLGGAQPYWQSFGYGAATDPSGRLGNRLSKTEHGAGGSTVTSTLSYNPQGASYPAAGSRRGSQPHAVTQVSETNGGSTTVWGYTHDDAGNMRTRPGPGGQQILDWDAEGHLAKVTEAGLTTSYVYDAEGQRLLAKDPQGTTLYLGMMELRLVPSLGVKATRYYGFGGETVAQRTTTALTWLCGDAQGTGEVAVTADAAQVVVKRRHKPFGEDRGTTTWVNDKGFLGGVKDPTGLTHIGAREYDPSLGRFISVDPMLDFSDAQQMNGYGYSYNSPVTFSDATGMLPFCESGFWCGVLSGVLNYFNPLKYIFMVRDFMKMMEDPKGAWDQFAGDAKKWGDKIGNEAAGWACAISGLCQVYDDCMNNADKYACGEFVGEMLLEFIEGIVVSAVTGGAAASAYVAKFAAKMIAKAAQRGFKLPSLKDKTPDGNDKKDGDKTPDSGGTDPSSDPNYNNNDDIKANQPGDGGDGTDKPCGCGCNSFDPATPVVMADGTAKAIADVQPGDQVLATDPEAGVTRAQPVTHLHLNDDRELVDVEISNGSGGTETVHTTAEHPFWNPTAQAWVPAGELRPGDRLASVGGDDVTVSVLSVRSWTGRKIMHNLTVDGIHTYYVIAAGTPVLVHNDAANDLGKRRERYIARLTGGKVARLGRTDEDFPLVGADGRKSGLDVLGPNGEYILVGGAAKAKDLEDFQMRLNITKHAADQAGVRAVYYLDVATPQSVVDLAKETFGADNVHSFTLPDGC